MSFDHKGRVKGKVGLVTPIFVTIYKNRMHTMVPFLPLAFFYRLFFFPQVSITCVTLTYCRH